jgi:hypothetical protein
VVQNQKEKKSKIHIEIIIGYHGGPRDFKYTVEIVNVVPCFLRHNFILF